MNKDLALGRSTLGKIALVQLASEKPDLHVIHDAMSGMEDLYFADRELQKDRNDTAHLDHGEFMKQLTIAVLVLTDQTREGLKTKVLCENPIPVREGLKPEELCGDPVQFKKSASYRRSVMFKLAGTLGILTSNEVVSECAGMEKDRCNNRYFKLPNV